MTKVTIVLGCLGTHGPSLIRAQLAAEMIRRGIAVDVVLGEDPDGLGPSLFEGCGVHILGTQRPRQFIGKLRAHLKQLRPDGVLASSWPFSVATIIAAKLYQAGIPVVISEHADFRTNIMNSGEFTKKDTWLIKHFSRFIYNRASNIVGVSQGVIDGLCEVAGVDRHKTKTIFNPLRSLKDEGKQDAFERAAREGFWNKDDIKLLAVGRLAKQKDYQTMLEALSILKDRGNYKLIIVGSGGMRAELEQQVVQMGLERSVLFAGTSCSLSEYYEDADLFVMSSSSEGFGNVLVEALSFGLPIVSTDCKSGPAEILLNGRFGFLTPVGDAYAFANGIEQALATPTDPETQKSRAAIFSIEAATDQYLSALFSKSS